MPKLDSPLKLAPVFKPKIWGRRDLAPLYPDHWTTRRGNTVSIRYPPPVSEELIGEVWLTDDEAVLLNGPLAGLTLAESCRRHARELCGEAGKDGRFPVLAKFIFTSEWLSIQVHPDDDYASQHEPGSLGKCEMWYILEAQPGAELLLGLRPGATHQQLSAAVDQGDPGALLQHFCPEEMEAVFVPPGALHALGPGLTLFEAEQNSDVTYRLGDFGRMGLDGKPRPLHREKALAVTRPELPAHRGLPRFELREVYGARRPVLACPFFAVEELKLQRSASFAGQDSRVEAFTTLSGEGRVETSAGWQAYRTGDIWLIPPATPSYRLVPEVESRLLKFYVPDLDEDFRKPLAQSGVNAEEIKRIVFA